MRWRGEQPKRLSREIARHLRQNADTVHPQAALRRLLPGGRARAPPALAPARCKGCRVAGAPRARRRHRDGHVPRGVRHAGPTRFGSGATPSFSTLPRLNISAKNNGGFWRNRSSKSPHLRKEMLPVKKIYFSTSAIRSLACPSP